MASHARGLTELPRRALLLAVLAVAAAMAAILTFGLPNTANAESPAIVPGYSAVSAGSGHICGLWESSGAVECWGRYIYGQTGAPAGRFSAVSAGGEHSCGLWETGVVECWGDNREGQTDAPAGRFSAVSAGWRHSCGLRETGAVECWGRNYGGQADAPSGRFLAVSAGWDYSCGLREMGAVECWGRNYSGQADAPSGRFLAVSAGQWHSCGLRETGAVECWGSNDYGQTDAPAGRFSAVSAGGEYSCGLRETGAVECWGSNDYGQTDAPAGRFSAVSAMSGWGGHGCGLRESGAVECWGPRRFVTDAPKNSILTGCRYADLGSLVGGAQRSGRWTAADCQREGRLYDVYRLSLTRVSNVDWRVEGRDADSGLHQEDSRLRAGSQRLTPGSYWLYVAGNAANAAKEVPYTLTVEVQPSDLSLDLDALAPTQCTIIDLGEVHGALVRSGVWTSSDCEDGGRYTDWYRFSLPPLGLPEAAGARQMVIDVLSPDADSIVTRVHCATDYRADPPVKSDGTLGDLSSSRRCFASDDDGGTGVNARLSWDVRTDSERLIYWVAVDTSDFGPATGTYTLRITAPTPAEGAPPSFGSEPTIATNFAGRIVARRLADGRTEFGWQPEGGERVLPRSRYFPADAAVNRWLRSSPIEVEGVEIGRINARLLADGRIEFGFTPDGGERILPRSRYFPAGAAVDRWLRSTVIGAEQ